MITKNRRIQYFNKSSVKKRVLIDRKSFDFWARKTVIRSVVSAIFILLIISAHLLNIGKSRAIINYIDEQLEYEANIEVYMSDLKDIYNHITLSGQKALEAVLIEDKLEKGFVVPVDGEIVTYFNENIGNTTNTSNGLIFSSDFGDEIRAVDDGVVIDVGSNKAIENYIIIKHKGELLSVYKYLETSYVTLNERVDKGQVIGESSDKLLLEVWYKKEPIDPVKYINLNIEQL